jgi:hypothetical protein
MLIFFYNRRRYVGDIKRLKETLKLDALSDGQRDRLTRSRNKGDPVYVAINPYDAEINGTRSLLIGDSQESLDQLVGLLSEEI